MSITHNATKKLCTECGINRVSVDFAPTLELLVGKYLQTLVEKVLLLVEYSGKKTIYPKDILFLTQIDPTYPVTVWSGKVDGFNYSRVSFKRKIKEIVKEFRDGEYQIGDGSFDLLQAMVEKNVKTRILQIRGNLIIEHRETVYARDLDM